MATTYDQLETMFFDRIEKDRSFFIYAGLDDSDSMAIAKSRADAYLVEACSDMMSLCDPVVDFLDMDNNARQFSFDMTGKELYLVSSLMYQKYLEKDIAYLRSLDVNFTTAELKVFDPSNARTTYLEMVRYVKEQNERLLEEYRSRDRITGEWIGADYSESDG